MFTLCVLYFSSACYLEDVFSTSLATIHRLFSYDPQGALLFNLVVSVEPIIFKGE